MAPEYRDGAWIKDLDDLNAYAAVGQTGDYETCRAPALNASVETWKNKSAFHSACGADSYCCLDSDYFGCDPTWNAGDSGGWVDVLRQDVNWGRQFRDLEWRRRGHHSAEANFAILDELEWMRRLSDGRIELQLDWPGSEFEMMHWAQRLNPAQFNRLTKAEQYDEDVLLQDIVVPYGSYDYWGGLEYDGVESLLDGSFAKAAKTHYFQVGGIRQRSGLRVTTGALTPDESTTHSRVRLRAKPSEYYFEPKCVRCEACYNADGYKRGTGEKRATNTTADSGCVLGDGCALNTTRYETVSGCPVECDGLKIRAFEVSAAHQYAIVAARYGGENCTLENATLCAFTEARRTDVASKPYYNVGVGSYAGFFVAPVTGEFTFTATWDASAEVLLSDTADPRRRKIVIGGPRDSQPKDEDVVAGWTFFRGTWYKFF
ncbi:hypothetical protein M885DRAFT_431563, partial [Pelagophyceae sp. CCMP2097]